jgi:hypothetical protein
MTTAAVLVVGAIVAIAAVVVVALPYLREPQSSDDRLVVASEAEEHRLILFEERDHALAALKELEFDHRTGKITDEDYQLALGPLRAAAAEALRALDADTATIEASEEAALNDVSTKE